MVLLISIIKIIGIIVLIIAAVILTLLAAVLFVPLRYHIEGSFHEEKPCASASVKWMLGILSFRASYSGEDGARAYICMFGRCIYDLLDDSDKEDTDSDTAGSGIGDNETGTNSVSSDNGKQDVLPAAKQLMIEDKAKDAVNADDAGMSDYAQNAAVRERILSKLRYTADKISAAVDAAELKMKELAAQAAEIFRAVKNAFEKRSGQLNELIGLWKDERYQASEKLLTSRIVKLLKEIRPRKGHGKLRIGFGDPYGTGQAMQIAALLYPLYGDRIEVIPDFDQSVIDGEANLKGRLRLIVPVEAAVRIFFDKRLKSMYKQARGILELD